LPLLLLWLLLVVLLLLHLLSLLLHLLSLLLLPDRRGTWTQAAAAA
jgi:hypothetical protein